MKIIENPQTTIYYKVRCCNQMETHRWLFSANERGAYIINNDTSNNPNKRPYYVFINFCPFCGKGLEKG